MILATLLGCDPGPGDQPSDSEQIPPVTESGCCPLAYDHDVGPCEWLGFTCGDDGWVVPPP